MERIIYAGRDNNGKLALYSDTPQWLSIYREFAPNAKVSKEAGLFVELDPQAMSEDNCPRGEFVRVSVTITVVPTP